MGDIIESDSDAITLRDGDADIDAIFVELADIAQSLRTIVGILESVNIPLFMRKPAPKIDKNKEPYRSMSPQERSSI